MNKYDLEKYSELLEKTRNDKGLRAKMREDTAEAFKESMAHRGYYLTPDQLVSITAEMAVAASRASESLSALFKKDEHIAAVDYMARCVAYECGNDRSKAMADAMFEAFLNVAAKHAKVLQ
jgi:hypothetical protein